MEQLKEIAKSHVTQPSIKQGLSLERSSVVSAEVAKRKAVLKEFVNYPNIIIIDDVDHESASTLGRISDSFICTNMDARSIVLGRGLLEGSRLYDFKIHRCNVTGRMLAAATARSGAGYSQKTIKEYSLNVIMNTETTATGRYASTIEMFLCNSCKAGLGKFKHIAALLLYCQEFVSIASTRTSTSKLQVWSKRTKTIAFQDRKLFAEKVLLLLLILYNYEYN